MPLTSLSLIGAAIFLASFLSGVFGIAGGMVLLGVLLIFFDVATAMVMFSLLSTTGNTWRVVTWRRYIRWKIFFFYIVGGSMAFLLLRFIALVPRKAMIYLILGLMPYALEALPRSWCPNIEWRGVPTVTGFITTSIQLMAGNGGMFLDIFFQKSGVDRKTTVATKSICQSFGNVSRILYFGTLGGVGEAVPLWAFGPAILLAIGGTALAPLLLERMTDHDFRRWTRKLIFLVSTVYLLRAGWLYWHQ